MFPEFQNLKEIYQQRGARGWNMRNYHIFKEKIIGTWQVYVRELNIKITPFESWVGPEDPPSWWGIYNAIKHDGLNSKMKINSMVALEILSALFALHCCNYYTMGYLKQFRQLKVGFNFSQKSSKVFHDAISTPIDSRRFLFKDVPLENGSSYETKLILKPLIT
ncbi:MAG: hypothetical protein EOO43_23630 [Flavobacterium sp.]|nr:MAG: hypothetical protein EOO43_23630 [Flavobacterium sp.]